MSCNLNRECIESISTHAGAGQGDANLLAGCIKLGATKTSSWHSPPLSGGI